MNELEQMEDFQKLLLLKNKDTLKSFTHQFQVINFLALQKNYFFFLTAIRAVKGCRIVLHEDMTTSIVFNNQEIEGTRKRRFANTTELGELLTLTQLN